jgi:hypothetical protein
MAEEPVERFRPTSGRLLGAVGLALVIAVLAAGVLDSDGDLPVTMIAGAVLFGALIWSAMLRPGVWVTEGDLVMRNMLDTVRIPLAAIESVVVRQVLVVGAGDSRYVSPAIGHSWRQTFKATHGGAARRNATESYPVFVEERISRLAEDARARLGVERYSDEQVALASGVRRQPAWAEISVLAVAGVVFVVSLLV